LLIDFFHIICNLKNISRKGWIDKLSIDNPESVAEHSFSMATMAMIFSDLNQYNTEKILKMSLLHDLAESVIGDLTPGEISKIKKAELENKTMKNILENLPPNLAEYYSNIWNEYQDNQTEESILVHEFDRLDMVFQAKKYSESGHNKEKLETFFETAKNEIKNKELSDMLSKLIQ